MKKKFGFILFILTVSCFVCGLAFAKQDLTFAWDPNSETDLAGYRLYRSATPGNYIYGSGKELAQVPAGTETVKVTTDPGYFVLTAFDTHGNESGPSNELETMAPVVPNNVKISIIIQIP